MKIMDYQEYLKNLPKRHLAAGVIIWNSGKEFIIVKPTYRHDGWLLPGGTVEDGELPRETVRREVLEELNLKINPGRCLCVDVLTKGYTGKHDNVVMCFEGGKLTLGQVTSIKLPLDELSEFRFVSYSEARQMVCKNSAIRIVQALKAYGMGQTVYLENGTSF